MNIAITGANSGVGKILNDDRTLSISDVSQNEGNSGTTPFVFTVTLSSAATYPVTVKYATANGTASSLSDYVALKLTTLTGMRANACAPDALSPARRQR